MHLVPASRNTQQTLHCAAFCSQALLESSPAARGCRTQRSASNTALQKRTCLPAVAPLALLPLGWGSLFVANEKIGKELFVNFLFSQKTKAPETSVAERLGVWASACTSACRNTVDTGGVSPATAGRWWHSSRVRPQCPDPGQLERETQVQGPMGNLHLRGHSLWPGTWEGREGCFCNKINANTRAWERAPKQARIVSKRQYPLFFLAWEPATSRYGTVATP
jgi:hypothetical protein